MFPAPSSHVGALGPGCAGPSMMMDPEGAQLHARANKPSMEPHSLASGGPECCVDPATLLHGDPADPRQHTL